MPAFIDITGAVFNRWTVLGYAGKGTGLWNVRCECGTIAAVNASNLKRGATKSCGCLRRETSQVTATKHGALAGGCSSKTYSIWKAMKKRCSNTNTADYHRYGGRGIKVCDRWLSAFENFLADMGECPKDFTIDRINNDGDYEPGNCRWASRKEQSMNKPDLVWLDYKGSKITLSDFARSIGKSHSTVWRNVFLHKLTPEQIATRPNGRGKGTKVRKYLQERSAA